MRVKAFATRNIKELLRDPLSYIFCLGFPLIMLVIMTLVGQNIPQQEGLNIFNIQNQSAGTAVFGIAFIMLFAALLISKDRATALLCRLFASPMKSIDFILGYAIPLAIITILQLAVNVISTVVISIVIGQSINIVNLLASFIVYMPTAIMFIGFGIIFGSLFSDKASPGISSVIISLAPIMGGVWMSIDAMGGVMLAVAKIFPFYHAVKAARTVIAGSFDIAQSMLILCIWAVAIFALSVIVFKTTMRSEKK